MMVVPPLIWLGAPLFPLLRGLPRADSPSIGSRPLLRSRGLRRFSASLTHPLAALPLFVAATWLWHVPAMYELGAAFRRAGTTCSTSAFSAAALLFWYPVVRPYPSRPRWSLWLLIPYLILADVQNTVLSALLTFSDRVLYPYYAEVPRLGGHVGAGRSGDGRRDHVGAGIGRVSRAAVVDRRAAAVRREAEPKA